MKFLKIFLASLLAVVVGGVVSSLLWLFVIIGLAGSIESNIEVKPNSVLVIDFAEDITDAPAANPFGSIDFNTFTIHKQLSLAQVLRSIEAAKKDDRIKGIYLRLNGSGSADIAAIEAVLFESTLELKSVISPRIASCATPSSTPLASA